MKTAVSIPDEIFEEAERLAERLRTSRSRLYSQALREYVRRHTPDHVTETLNRVIDDVGTEENEFRRAAARRTLRKVEW
jgi:metal-responsive CopG/Arc/MetJ family transcriptional regulator